jgi:hypothetical protein
MEKFYSYLKKRYTQLDMKGNLNIAWKLVIRDSVIFVFVLWALTFILFINGEKEWRGTFGDMFGAVNALFSGLAFAGLIITLIMQHEELKLQRQELKQTNEELEGQKKEFEEQNKTLKVQRFENTLFNMLSQQQEITNNLNISGNEITGRNVFRYFYKEASFQAKDAYVSFTTMGIVGLIRGTNNIHSYSSTHGIELFDHYFRHLYRIFKYINDSKLIDVNDKYEYASIVRAQLSEYELLMLFYNALNVKEDGIYKFKSLIETYALLNNIRKKELARKNDLNLYLETAYRL